MADTEEARFLAERSTPRSEQKRSAWGSLQMALVSDEMTCPKGRCILKRNHSVSCWPKEN